MMINNADSNFIVETSFTTIKATMRVRKQWGLFAVSLFVFLFQAFFVLPIAGFILFGIVQDYFPIVVQWIIMLGVFSLYLYLLYKKSLETAQYAFDRDTVEINDQSITVERYGFLFIKTRKTFQAEDVRGITASFHFQNQFNFLNRFPFVSSKFGGFMVWQHRLTNPFYFFGNGVSPQNADAFLELVYRRFPKYRLSGLT